MEHDGKYYLKLGLPSGTSFPTDPAPAEGDIFYRTDEDTPYAYNGASWESVGGGGYCWHTFLFTFEGALTVGAKPLRIYVPSNYTVDKVYIAVNTAPTGSSIIVDVNKNGTTIFTTQGNRPEIAIGANTDESGTPDVTALVKNDYLTYDIDQIGSTVAGSDLTVHVRCQHSVI